MNESEFIEQILDKETASGCYEITINGISVYMLIRQLVRNNSMHVLGLPTIELTSKINKLKTLYSTFISISHIFTLFITNRKCKYVFYAFPRVDKIGDYYMDKFTDPLISASQIDNYIIFDPGRAGVHPRPRYNNKNIVYTDFVTLLSILLSFLFYPYFCIKYKKAIKALRKSLIEIFGSCYDKKYIERKLWEKYIGVCIYRRFFKFLKTSYIIGPVRSVVLYNAAKLEGIVTIELQHGITYGLSNIYSGYRETKTTPDYFMAFGDNKPLNVYGVREDKIINIGWALQDYIASIPQKIKYSEKDVLVISEPEITDIIIEVILNLAKNNSSITFYVRPHPQEQITESHLEMISKVNNVKIQDKTVNISIVLQGFTHVIGENSTVLYEALAVNKKVGKLFYKDLKPIYLEEKDKDCFWEIHNQTDFEKFIIEDVSSKKNKCIYSKFNKELFCKTIGLDDE